VFEVLSVRAPDAQPHGVSIFDTFQRLIEVLTW